MAEERMRRSERKATKQLVRCRSPRGIAPSAWMVDVSPTGCQLLLQGGRFRAGELVIVRPEGFGDFAGYVRWARADRAGIEFRESLHQSVADHLVKTAVTAIDDTPGRAFGVAESLGRRMLRSPNVTVVRSVA